MKTSFSYLPAFFIIILLGLTACQDDSKEASFTTADLPAERDAAAGQELFENGDGDAPACKACHSVDGDDGATGPSLRGFANEAGERVDNETAEEYALNSIIAPGKYVVDGYRNNMFSQYDDKLAKQQIADLIAYLLTLN